MRKMELSSGSDLNNILDFYGTDTFFLKYHSIHNKLKKRFMRNPNVADASDEFSKIIFSAKTKNMSLVAKDKSKSWIFLTTISLAAQCEHEKTWQYAGICYLAVARCYHTLKNKESEINYLVKAGKYFLAVNTQNIIAGCPTIGLADLQAASSCVSDISICCKNNSKYNVMTVGSITKLANALGPIPAGEQLFRNAIIGYATIQSINILISYCLKQDEYTNALNIANDLIHFVESIATYTEFYRSCLHKTVVNRLMMMIIVQQTSQNLPTRLAEIVEKFTLTTDDLSLGPNINEDEFLVLQSLILACQLHDIQALLELEVELWKYMDNNQKDFLRSLIRIVTGQ